MAQWPFAHEYEITYGRRRRTEVQTTVSNLSADPMPIALAFHPYYRIPDVSRDQVDRQNPGAQIVIAETSGPLASSKAYDMPDPLPLQRTLIQVHGSGARLAPRAFFDRASG